MDFKTTDRSQVSGISPGAADMSVGVTILKKEYPSREQCSGDQIQRKNGL
jgi:hypothetical protein